MMVWNVWRHNINNGLMETWNVFEHYNFNKDTIRDLRDFDDKEEFSRHLQSNLMYYFWCKSEYEIIIAPWCGTPDTKEKKIDIYMQIMVNWIRFVDYVWSFKKGD